MDDTPAKIDELYRQMLMSRSPSERLKMASGMYDSARKLVIAGILSERQDLTPSQLRAELFLRMYGNDFTSAEKERITQGILNMQRNSET